MEKPVFADEILMAFADGQLDSETRLAVERAMAEDNAIATRVESFMRSAKLAKAAMGSEQQMSVPKALENRVRKLLEKAGENTSPAPVNANVVEFRLPTSKVSGSKPASQVRRGALPLAASVALVAGSLTGYIAGSSRPTDTAGIGIALLADPAVDGALRTIASGASREIGNVSELRAIASYRDSDGLLCREFELDGKDGTALVSVACMVNAKWDVRFAIASRQSGEGYAPASSLEALDAFLQSSGAIDPLTSAAEAAALQALR